MFYKILLVGIVALVQYIDAAVVPFITKCKPDDTKCIKSSTQAIIPIFAKGIPELGMSPLDPFFMKSLDASTGDLHLVLKDITGTGLNDCIAKKIQLDIAKMKLLVKLQCTVDFEGQYEMNGRLLILPIEGNGRAHVVLNKMVISAEADLAEVTGPDGKEHWKIKNYKHSYELKDKAIVELENLFNGNKDFGRAAADLLQSSPNEIVTEVGPPIVKAVVHEIVQHVQQFFKQVPVEEMVEK